MAEKLPLKADTTNGIIRDFETGDFIGVSVGGTGLTTIPSGAMLFASALNTLAALSIGAAGRILQSNGTIPQWVGNVAGVSGGRTFHGGTASGDYLLLNSTSHATPGPIYFGNNLAANYSQATGVWDTAFKGAGVRYIQTMSNYNGSTVGAAGDGVGILCLGSDNAGTPALVSLGRIKVVSETVAAGSVSGSFAIDVSNSGTLRQVYKVDENADTHTWALNNSTLLTLAPTLLTLASGVGLTLPSGTITVTSGDTDLKNGTLFVRKKNSGQSNVLELINDQVTGATSDSVAIRGFCSDDTGTSTTGLVASILLLQTVATAGAQSGNIVFNTRIAGVTTPVGRFNTGSFNSLNPIGAGLASLTTAPARMGEFLDASNPQIRFTQNATGPVCGEWQRTSTMVQLLIDTVTKWTCNPDGIISRKSVYCTADRTTTSSTLGDVTDLSIPLKADSKYFFKFFANTSCNSASGNRYAVQYSAAGATIEATIDGTTTAVTARRMERISAFNTAATAMNTVNGAGSVRIEGMIETGANAGNLTIRSKVVTATTTTCTIRKYACLAVDQISP